MAELTTSTLQGSGTTLMALTSLVAGTRLVSGLRHTGLRGVRWDDGWLFAGYVLFMAVGGAYAARGPELARLGRVQQQQQRGPLAVIAPYPGWAAERAAVRRLVVFADPGLWLALWCVKFSLLALYRNIMIQAYAYARAWWAVSIYCILSLLGLIILHIVMVLCYPITNWSAPSDLLVYGNLQGMRVTIWVSYGVDISTVLAVMILPIHLIGTLEMPRHIKMSLGFLFGLGILVIIAATARVIQIGTSDDPCPSLAWLSLWSTIESSVAIIVGCGPGLYRQGNGTHPLRPTNYYLTPGNTTVTAASTQGKCSSGTSRTRYSHLHDIPLSPYAYPVATTVQARRDWGNSEEQLVRSAGRSGIIITKSVQMESEVELSRPDKVFPIGRAVSC